MMVSEGLYGDNGRLTDELLEVWDSIQEPCGDEYGYVDRLQQRQNGLGF